MQLPKLLERTSHRRYLALAMGLSFQLTAQEMPWSRPNDLGNQQLASGECRSAWKSYQQATNLARRQLPALDPTLTIPLSNQGTALYCLGEYRKSEVLYRAALTRLDEARVPHGMDRAEILNNLGVVLTRLDRRDEAETAHLQGLSLFEASAASSASRRALGYNGLGVLHHRRRNDNRAVEMFTRAAGLWEAELGPNHLFTATAWNNLGVTQLYLGKISDARATLDRALQIRITKLPSGHPELAEIFFNFAAALRLSGLAAEAKSYETTARGIRQRHLRSNIIGLTVDLKDLKRRIQ